MDVTPFIGHLSVGLRALYIRVTVIGITPSEENITFSRRGRQCNVLLRSLNSCYVAIPCGRWPF